MWIAEEGWFAPLPSGWETNTYPNPGPNPSPNPTLTLTLTLTRFAALPSRWEMRKDPEGFQPVGPVHRAVGKGLLHRAALIDHQSEVKLVRAGRLGRGRRRRGRRRWGAMSGTPCLASRMTRLNKPVRLKACDRALPHGVFIVTAGMFTRRPRRVRRRRGCRRRGTEEHRQPLRRDRVGVVDLHQLASHMRHECGAEGGGNADEDERAGTRSGLLRL